MDGLSDMDFILIESAKNVIDNNYCRTNNNHTVGAALRCKEGEIYVGINIHSNHGYCAEIVALGAALAAGKREFDCIVAVDNQGDILPPCGTCRQILSEYAYSCKVIVKEGEKFKKVVLPSLLPFPYFRKNTLSQIRARLK